MKQLKVIEENLNMVIGTLNLVKEKIECFQEKENGSEFIDMLAGINLSQDKIIESADEIAEMIIQQSA